MISQLELPSCDDIFKFSDLPRDERAESKLLREVPLLVQKGNLSLVWTKGAWKLERFLYYLIAAIGTTRPIRLFLRSKSRGAFLDGLMKSYIGRSRYDLHSISFDKNRQDEMMKLYAEAERRIRSLDLGISDITGWSVEDVVEYYDSNKGRDLSGSVVIFDSLTAMTSESTPKWDIARAVIGARLKDWIRYDAYSVILLDNVSPNLYHSDMYEGIDEYLDGTLSIHPFKHHGIASDRYDEEEVIFRYKRCTSSFTFYFDWQADRYIDEHPETRIIEETESADIDQADIPF